jgi:hypothetical protein
LPGLGRHKGRYRFFSNGRFGEDAILSGHFAATASRVEATAGPIFVIQDTPELVFAWAKPETVGAIGRGCTGRDRDGKPRIYTQCGLLMHASLVVTPEGLPLGLAAAKFWTRSKFKGTSELKRHVNPTRVSIDDKESMRWLENMRQSTALLGTPNRLVHLGDRESDIYELFCEASKLGTHFLVRTCVDRLAVDGKRTVAAEMATVPAAGMHRIEVTAEDGSVSEAELELRYPASMSCRRLASRSATPPSSSRSCTLARPPSRRGAPASTGNLPPTCPSPLWTRRSRSCAGMRAAGKSSCSTRC